MFSKALLVAFLSLSFSAQLAFAAPAPEPCEVSSSAAAISTAALVSTGGNSNFNKGGSASKGNTGSKAGSGSGAAAASASSASNNHVDAGVPSSSAAAAASTGTASSSSGSSGDLQSSLSLDPSLVATGFAQDGNNPPVAGQASSLTSTNNFINFCDTVSTLPITNGLQIKTGSCNPAPMGVIAATTAMPSSKFTFPSNLATIQSNTNFTVTMAIQNIETGFFVNATSNYFSAPQFTNAQGLVQGHSHVVIEQLQDISQTTPTNPGTFQFFKGFDDAAVNGVLSAAVAGGLPAGTYRMASITSAANHQPVLVAVAQHGALDDMVYFYVTDNGQPPAGSTGSTAATGTAAAASGTAVAAGATASSTAAATSNQKGNTKGNAAGGAAVSSAAGGASSAVSSADAVASSAVASASAAASTAASKAGSGAAAKASGAVSSAAAPVSSAASKAGSGAAANAGGNSKSATAGSKFGRSFRLAKSRQ